MACRYLVGGLKELAPVKIMSEGGNGAYSGGLLFTYSRQIFVQGLGSIGRACSPYISGTV
jgi:hypothetical protein